MDLAGLAPAGRNPAGDLPQADLLALARAVGDVQVRGGVGKDVLVCPAAVISAGHFRERRAGQVSGGALAVGEQVEPGGQDVGEQSG
jgi:hypothetical protein